MEVLLQTAVDELDEDDSNGAWLQPEAPIAAKVRIVNAVMV